MKLKSNVKTSRGIYIVSKAEKALLNERVRTINNTINMFNWQIDTCKQELQNKINREDMEECNKLIEGKRDKAPKDIREKKDKF